MREVSGYAREPHHIYILDNLKLHYDKKINEWLEVHKQKIQVFYLPPSSPEHNPDEYFNNDLKGRVPSGIPARSFGY